MRVLQLRSGDDAVVRGIIVPINLRFFDEKSAGEKTEKATPKKKEKAREEGQVAKSQEISTAAMFLVGFFALSIFAGGMLNGILDLFSFNSQLMPELPLDFEQVRLARHVAWGFGQVLLIAAPLMAVSLIVGLVVNILQVGWKVTTKPLKPKFSKLNPLKGFKRIFSLQSLVNFAKSMLKLLAVGIVVYMVLVSELPFIPLVLGMSFVEVVGYIGGLIINLGIAIGVLYVFIAILDYSFMRWKHNKDLRMTKQEVKDEYKQMEGDPKVRAAIRQRMREVSMRRMMQSVPHADVVITNPTHYAVALKYDLSKGFAPILCAKGVDYVARRIRETAEEHDVTIVENPPLARSIYDEVEIGQEIPQELYVAVAEILAYVFKLKNRVA